jgi:hypothetical protein
LQIGRPEQEISLDLGWPPYLMPGVLKGEKRIKKLEKEAR